MQPLYLKEKKLQFINQGLDRIFKKALKTTEQTRFDTQMFHTTDLSHETGHRFMSLPELNTVQQQISIYAVPEKSIKQLNPLMYYAITIIMQYRNKEQTKNTNPAVIPLLWYKGQRIDWFTF